MPAPIAPVTLTGRTVRLEPLALDHVDALAAVAFDGPIFRWYPVNIDTPADLERWVRDALAAQEAGTALPFATVLLDGERVVGSTRFMNISVYDGRFEIGSTWVTPRHQRTAVNTESKLLMLRHAFDTLGARRVELKTHALNEQSRRGIERLGAQFEGTHRNHMLMADGSMRDTVWYSIIDTEWPAVKARLEAWLEPGHVAPSLSGAQS
ncbi:MAG: GNAT family protein [Gemmatimonadetes bacterium]|nr:GNAT family protein [Gemmatimonadota bacterium]